MYNQLIKVGLCMLIMGCKKLVTSRTGKISKIYIKFISSTYNTNCFIVVNNYVL